MPRLIDADKLEPIEVGIDEMSFLAVDYDDIKNAPTIEPCEDAISIEVAVQTTWMILNGMGYPKDQNEELDQTIKAVFDTAPRVAPSRPSGEWISVCGNKQCDCSVCGEGFDHTYEWIEGWNFCPNCGAQMKGADDE